MEDKYLVNQSFDQAIEKYIQYNDDFVSLNCNEPSQVILQQLALIYNDLDFINPYITKDYATLLYNFSKYGYDLFKIENFFADFESFSQAKENKEKQLYFEALEKALIDMFALKKDNYTITSNEYKNFKDLLFTPQSSNPLIISYAFLLLEDSEVLLKYYQRKMEIKPKTSPKPFEKEYEKIAEDLKKVFEKKTLFNFNLKFVRGNINIFLIIGILIGTIMFLTIVSKMVR